MFTHSGVNGEYYFHYDNFGNTVLLTDENGVPQYTALYDISNGKRIQEWNPNDLQFSFKGGGQAENVTLPFDGIDVDLHGMELVVRKYVPISISDLVTGITITGRWWTWGVTIKPFGDCPAPCPPDKPRLVCTCIYNCGDVSPSDNHEIIATMITPTLASCQSLRFIRVNETQTRLCYLESKECHCEKNKPLEAKMKKVIIINTILFIIIIGIVCIAVNINKKNYINKALKHLIEGNTKYVLFYSEKYHISGLNSCLKEEDIRMYVANEEVSRIVINDFINTIVVNHYNYEIYQFNIVNFEITYKYNINSNLILKFQKNMLINAELKNDI